MAGHNPQENTLDYTASDGSYQEKVLDYLSTGNTSSNVISATNGSFIVNNAVDKVIDSYAIVVLEDTIFTSIKILAVDQKATLIADTAIAVKAGAILRPTTGVFSSVQLTSGSVALVL
jgi:hypothetical protein